MSQPPMSQLPAECPVPAQARTSQVREPNTFGEPRQRHSITFTRNGRSREYCINPVFLTFLAGFVALFGIGYIGATTYLVMRDDLNAMRTARNTRVQYEYEDRISALRTNLDRVTSRQLLDQQQIETKVFELIERQKLLNEQNPVVNSILKKAGKLGLELPHELTKELPRELPKELTGSTIKKKQKQASVSAAPTTPFPGNLFSLRGLGKEQNLALEAELEKSQPNSIKLAAATSRQEFSIEKNTKLFNELAKSMDEIEVGQKQIISTLRISAKNKLAKVALLMNGAGINSGPTAAKSSDIPTASSIGGIYEPLDAAANFNSHVDATLGAFDALDEARATFDLVPVTHPVPGKKVSSRFGSRVDPFKGTYAMHSGMDFKANSGSPVKAAATGRVIYAAIDGGYGKKIEIEHANGLITRYAHLSKILVKKGQQIKAGTIIAKVGSTGRSTGPHLHYAILQNRVAVNPKKYLAIGKKLAGLL